MIVIFDGMDKVGKTTLIHELNKATQFEHIIIDRGPNSYLVYDDIYKRGHKVDYYKTEMDIRNSSHLCVYCFADKKDIEARLKAANESFEKAQGSIDRVSSKFNNEMLKSNLNTIFIDTSKTSIKEAIGIILTHIERNKYDFIKLRPKNIESDYIEYYPSCNSFSEEILATLPKFNKKVDELYYNMLTCSLNHMLHKYEIDWLNHRQLVYTSSDCISLIQLILSDEGALEIFVHQRSLNLGKHAENDLMFIYDWAKKNLKYDKLFIHYTVGCPHEFL